MKAIIRSDPFRIWKMLTGLVLLPVVLFCFSACDNNKDDEEDNTKGQIEVSFQFNKLETDFQQKGIPLIMNRVSYDPSIGSNTPDIINYLLLHSFMVDRDAGGQIQMVQIAPQPPHLKDNLSLVINNLVGTRSVLPYRVEWSYLSQPFISITLIDAQTKEIIYDPVASSLTTRIHEISGRAFRLIGTKWMKQPTNPGDLTNIWLENIFGWDLAAIAISWGTAFCNAEGCIVVPADPNMMIQVEIETTLGWTADAVVSGYQISPDCKSVTFQITIVAAGPLASINVEYDQDGFKVGATVTGPVGTYKKTMNAIMRCP